MTYIVEPIDFTLWEPIGVSYSDLLWDMLCTVEVMDDELQGLRHCTYKAIKNCYNTLTTKDSNVGTCRQLARLLGSALASLSKQRYTGATGLPFVDVRYLLDKAILSESTRFIRWEGVLDSSDEMVRFCQRRIMRDPIVGRTIRESLAANEWYVLGYKAALCQEGLFRCPVTGYTYYATEESAIVY